MSPKPKVPKVKKERKANSNKCAICSSRGNKGYFSVPKDKKAEWQLVITESITNSTRVCYRHFAGEDLVITPAAMVLVKKGMS